MQISKMRKIADAFSDCLRKRKEKGEVGDYEINFVPDDCKIEIIVSDVAGRKMKTELKIHGGKITL